MAKLSCTKETYERFVDESLSNINESMRDLTQQKRMSEKERKSIYDWMMWSKEMFDSITAQWEDQGGELPEVTICKNCKKSRKECSVCDNRERKHEP